MQSCALRVNTAMPKSLQVVDMGTGRVSGCSLELQFPEPAGKGGEATGRERLPVSSAGRLPTGSSFLIFLVPLWKAQQFPAVFLGCTSFPLGILEERLWGLGLDFPSWET